MDCRVTFVMATHAASHAIGHSGPMFSGLPSTAERIQHPLLLELGEMDDGYHGLGQYTRGTCLSSVPTGAAWVLAAAGGLEAGCSPCYLQYTVSAVL